MGLIGIGGTGTSDLTHVDDLSAIIAPQILARASDVTVMWR
jgi:hypothetical protein